MVTSYETETNCKYSKKGVKAMQLIAMNTLANNCCVFARKKNEICSLMRLMRPHRKVTENRKRMVFTGGFEPSSSLLLLVSWPSHPAMAPELSTKMEVVATTHQASDVHIRSPRPPLPPPHFTPYCLFNYF